MPVCVCGVAHLIATYINLKQYLCSCGEYESHYHYHSLHHTHSLSISPIPSLSPSSSLSLPLSSRPSICLSRLSSPPFYLSPALSIPPPSPLHPPSPHKIYLWQTDSGAYCFTTPLVFVSVECGGSGSSSSIISSNINSSSSSSRSMFMSVIKLPKVQ